MEKNTISRTDRGFTLIELLLVISISAGLTVGLFAVYISFNKTKSFEASTQNVANFLKEARSLTLASKNADVYGVHLETARIVLFTGATFSDTDPRNREYIFGSDIELTTINLTGGGSDIVFDRLTGETGEFGTTTISRPSDTSITKDIVIQQTGVVEL